MKKLAFLDLETTALSPRFGNLWEIGLIIRDFTNPDSYGDVRDEEYWWQIRPDLEHAAPESVQIGDYYNRCKLTDKPVDAAVQLHTVNRLKPNHDLQQIKSGDVISEGTARGVARVLAKLLDRATIVANNPTFDRRFAEKFLTQQGQILTAHHRMIDIRALLIGYIDGANDAAPLENTFPPEAVPLVRDWLYGDAENPSWEIVGVTQAPESKHTALGDARLVREVYDAIRGND